MYPTLGFWGCHVAMCSICVIAAFQRNRYQWKHRQDVVTDRYHSQYTLFSDWDAHIKRMYCSESCNSSNDKLKVPSNNNVDTVTTVTTV